MGGTSLIAQVWFHSSQAFDKLLWSSDLLLGHADGLGPKRLGLHLGVVAHLDCFLSVEFSLLDLIEGRQ